MFSRYEKFRVFDDFIGPSYQKEIEEGVGGYATTWCYQSNMDYADDGRLPKSFIEFEHNNDQKYSQFVLEILGMDKVVHGPLHYGLLGLTTKIVDELIPGYKNYRTRGILQTPIPNPPKHYLPHTDCYTSMKDVWSFIYYVNEDATGDTYLFNEQIEDINMEQRRTHDWNPIDVVSPKKGRLIMFPARQYHAGSPPIRDRRMLINFNFSVTNFG